MQQPLERSPGTVTPSGPFRGATAHLAPHTPVVAEAHRYAHHSPSILPWRCEQTSWTPSPSPWRWSAGRPTAGVAAVASWPAPAGSVALMASARPTYGPCCRPSLRGRCRYRGCRSAGRRGTREPLAGGLAPRRSTRPGRRPPRTRTETLGRSARRARSSTSAGTPARARLMGYGVASLPPSGAEHVGTAEHPGAVTAPRAPSTEHRPSTSATASHRPEHRAARPEHRSSARPLRRPGPSLPAATYVTGQTIGTARSPSQPMGLAPEARKARLGSQGHQAPCFVAL